MSGIAISVENLSKRYLIGHQRAKGDGFRHLIEDAVRAPARWLSNRSAQKKEEIEEFWALRDLSLEIKQGEVVGIVGRDGAGKSTLLKILSRITEPTKGRIQIEGRVASLLEVGTGFHAELTGRENIFLNGAILGMSRAEIKRKFDEIVAFSEVERFLDTPVKRYSSGMYVRLAFAVAAHLEPEILIVDEVLAVGDVQFQAKCLGKMQQVASSEGRTILFVSHNMLAVRSLCSKGVLLARGSVKKYGTAEEITDAYLANSEPQRTEREWSDDKSAPGNEYVTLRRLSIQPASNGDPFSIRSRLVVTVELINRRDGMDLDCCLALVDNSGQMVLTAASFHNERRVFPRFNAGVVTMRCEIPGDLLNNGTYTMDVQINRDVGSILYKLTDALKFDLADDDTIRGGYHGVWPGAVRPLFRWNAQTSEL